MIGETLGDFRVLEKLGEGGMGVVYKACHAEDKDIVRAIKVIRPEFAQDKGFKKRFQDERKLIVELTHPHIVRGYHFGTSDGMPYLVTEFVEGENLQERLKRSGRLSPKETVQLASEICSALSYAHKKGVIHRDLKPGNIMLREGTDEAVLTDFGIVKMVGEGSFLKTMTGKLGTGGGGPLGEAGRGSTGGGLSEVGRGGSADGGEGPSPGTIAYMSPEQEKGEEVTLATDIYSLGVVLYECLAGDRPRIGESLCEINADVHPHLELAILRCLKRKPSERFSSAGALLEEMRAGIQKADRDAEEAAAIREFTEAIEEAEKIAKGTHQTEAKRRAQPPSESSGPPPQRRPEPSPQERTRQLVAEADALFRKRRYPAAMDKCQEALALMPGDQEATALLEMARRVMDRINTLIAKAKELTAQAEWGQAKECHVELLTLLPTDLADPGYAWRKESERRIANLTTAWDRRKEHFSKPWRWGVFQISLFLGLMGLLPLWRDVPVMSNVQSVLSMRAEIASFGRRKRAVLTDTASHATVGLSWMLDDRGNWLERVPHLTGLQRTPVERIWTWVSCATAWLGVMLAFCVVGAVVLTVHLAGSVVATLVLALYGLLAWLFGGHPETGTAIASAWNWGVQFVVGKYGESWPYALCFVYKAIFTLLHPLPLALALRLVVKLSSKFTKADSETTS